MMKGGNHSFKMCITLEGWEGSKGWMTHKYKSPQDLCSSMMLHRVYR